MNELERIFTDAGVNSEETENALKYLEVTTVEELALYLSEEDYKKAGISSPKARKKLVLKANAIQKQIDEAQFAERQAAEAAQNKSIKKEEMVLLAQGIDNLTLIDSLQQQGTLNFNSEIYMAGIKATLAGNLGVFASVEKLHRMILEYSMANGLPASKLLHRLQAIMTRRQYGLVFAVTEGRTVDGVPIYATSDEVAELMQRIKSDLVPTILSALNLI